MRENVAETAATADLAPVGIDQGILAYFLLFNYSSLSKYSVTLQQKFVMRMYNFISDDHNIQSVQRMRDFVEIGKRVMQILKN